MKRKINAIWEGDGADGTPGNLRPARRARCGAAAGAGDGADGAPGNLRPARRAGGGAQHVKRPQK